MNHIYSKCTARAVDWLGSAFVAPSSSVAILEQIPTLVLFYCRLHDTPSSDLSQAVGSVEKLYGLVRSLQMEQVFFPDLSQFRSVLDDMFGSNKFRSKGAVLVNRRYGVKYGYKVSNPRNIKDDLRRLAELFDASRPSLNRSVRIHNEFIRIHPVNDGNGTCARLLGCLGLPGELLTVWLVFCALMRRDFHLSFAVPLAKSARGDHQHLDQVSERYLELADSLVQRVLLEQERLCRFSADQTSESIRDLTTALLECPVQSIDSLARAGRQGLASEYTLESLCERLSIVELVEIDGNDCLVASGLLAAFEAMRESIQGRGGSALLY